MPSFRYIEEKEKIEVPFSLNAEEATLTIGDKAYPCDSNFVTIDGRRVPFWVDRSDTVTKVWLDGEIFTFECDDPRQRSGAGGSASNSGGTVKANMPGKVLQVVVKVGDTVKEGDNLLLMESMKMELALDASVNGIVKSVNVEADQMVSQGDVLVEITEDIE